MKNIINWLFVVVVICLCSCNDTVTERVEYLINEPVFMSADKFRGSVNYISTPRTIEKKGKICFYNGYLYISEPEVGIHVIDNRNPASPKSLGFVELLGNVDVSVKNDRLYADSYIDLVWFNLTDPAHPELAGRLENVFPYALPCIENEFGYDYDSCYEASTKGQIVVDWKLEKRSQLVTTYKHSDKAPMYDSALNSSSSGGMSSGVTGSMSRFGLYNNYLYVVMNSMMSIFNLAGDTPVKVGESFAVNWNVETIFPYKDYLFLGTPTGMAIYSVANPEKPDYICSVWHILGCDPVVVENDIAYVTVHADMWCRADMNANQLMIIDVSDVHSPNHLVTYSMKKPKGLGIDNGTLFVCDDGLQVFNAKDPMTLMANRLVHYPGMEGYDCIPYNNVLMMIADDGLYQYDYTDVTNISQLSFLKVGK